MPLAALAATPYTRSMIYPLDPRRLHDPVQAARYILGAEIIRTLHDGTILRGRIVEVEAYHEKDPASHTFRGQSVRNAAMFGPPAHAYIYFSYGIHWCFKITAGREGEGAGVLIRGVEPLEGIETMKKFRKQDATLQLTNGPAKLAQAFAIDKSLYGHDLNQPPLQVMGGGRVKESDITVAKRIGISQGVEELLRFYVTDSDFVSRR
jgi:DNA-3-methyladenine glycosylase